MSKPAEGSGDRHFRIACVADAASGDFGASFAAQLCGDVSSVLRHQRHATVDIVDPAYSGGSSYNLSRSDETILRIQVVLLNRHAVRATLTWRRFEGGGVVASGGGQPVEAGVSDAALNAGAARLLAGALVKGSGL